MFSTSHSETISVLNHPLVFHRWLPTVTPTAATFFLHGQGDFAERYEEIATAFTKVGIAFLTCDLPGHGQSPGKRGHIPSFELIRHLTRLGLAEARELTTGAIGICGHSVGGLLALAMLAEVQPAPDFSWISSPILVPEANQPTWKTACLRPISRLLPTLTLSTGVTAEMCRIPLPGETPTTPLLFHNRVSLRWGRELIDLGQHVRTHPQDLPKTLKLLLTQGARDRICPPEPCELFALKLDLPALQFKLFPNALHEPFADETKPEFFQILTSWLHSLI